MLAAAAVCATLVLLSGCARVRVAMAVSDTDRVTGEFIVAVVRGADTGGTPVPTGPPSAAASPGSTATAALGPLVTAELADRVSVQPYDQDGYLGTRVLCADLSFTEFSRLWQSDQRTKRLRLDLRRSGDVVVVSGSADLQAISAGGLDVQIKISFPGRVTETNGAEDHGTVTWLPAAGQVTELAATVRYAQPGALSWTGWAAMAGGAAGVVSLFVAVLAFVGHRRLLRREAAAEPA
jgi:hypothetical protein